MTALSPVPSFRRASRASLTVPLLACVLALSAAVLPAAAGKRPHIVLVMADDQGWGDMGYTGHPVVQDLRDRI